MGIKDVIHVNTVSNFMNFKILTSYVNLYRSDLNVFDFRPRTKHLYAYVCLINVSLPGIDPKKRGGANFKVNLMLKKKLLNCFLDK